MTTAIEQQEVVPTNEDPPQLQEQATEAQEVEGEGEAKKKANREAKYRTERNEARTNLAAALQRIEGYHRASAEQVAAGLLANPQDLWLDIDLADVLSDDEVDEDLVQDAVQDLLSKRPGLSKKQPAHDPTQGRGGGSAPTGMTWSDWIKS